MRRFALPVAALIACIGLPVGGPPSAAFSASRPQGATTLVAAHDSARTAGQRKGVSELDRAREAYFRGHYRVALPLLRKAARAGNIEAQILLAQALGDGKGTSPDPAASIRWLRKAAEAGSDEARYRLGEVMLTGRGVKSDASEAARLYLKAAEDGYAPAQAAIAQLLDDGQGIARDQALALSWYLKAAEAGLPTAASRLGEMYRLGEGTNTNLSEAVRWHRAAAEANVAASQKALADMLSSGVGGLKDLDQAIVLYEKANAQQQSGAKDGLAKAYFARGRERQNANSWDLALADYQAGLKLQPVNPQALLSLAHVLRAHHRFPEAVAAVDRALSLHPNWDEGLNSRGLLYREMRQFDAAQADFSSAIAANPKFALAYLNRGEVLQAVGDLEGAERDFHKAIEARPSSSLHHLALGRLLLLRGQPNEALAEVQAAIELEPEIPLNHVWHGLVLRYGGKPLDAFVVLGGFKEGRFLLVARYLVELSAGWADLAKSELAVAVQQMDLRRWPGPVFRALLGQISPDEAEAAASAAENEQMVTERRCGLHVFLGAARAAQGQSSEAELLLKRAEQECPVDLNEFVLAKLELARLQGNLPNLNDHATSGAGIAKTEAPASAAGAGIAQDAVLRALQENIYAGTLDKGVDQLVELAKTRSDDPNLWFALGITRFTQAVEHLAGGLYRHGAQLPREAEMMPFVRLPVPDNANPQPLTYEDMRAILQRFLDDLSLANSALAQVGDRAVEIPLELRRIRLNVTGAPGTTERLVDIVEPIFPGGAGLLPEIHFDTGDAHWLRGYVQLLSALDEFVLAHDWRVPFEQTFHLFFPRAGLPNSALLARGMDQFDNGAIADLVSFVHLLHVDPVEPARLEHARQLLLGTIVSSRASWASILQETDDQAEWIPSPRQTGVIQGMRVTDAMVRSWLTMLDEAESALEGRLLVPHWRTQQGFNLKRVFQEPRSFDVVLWVTGYAALAYVEPGRTIDSRNWEVMMSVFEGRFPLYMAWFN